MISRNVLYEKHRDPVLLLHVDELDGAEKSINMSYFIILLYLKKKAIHHC